MIEEDEKEYSPYHEWGDNWPYWNDLYKAETYIYKYVYKYSKCRMNMKEKYGTLRYSDVIPPRWTRYIFNCRLYYLYKRFANKILIKAVNKAIKKFPNIKKELIDDLDW